MSKINVNTVKIKWLSKSRSDKETLERCEKYGDWRKILLLENEVLNLAELENLINAGERVFIDNKNESEEKTIYCEITTGDPWDHFIPRVIKSSHSRFGVGTRFDYGFMHVSLEDGYSIQYN